MHYCIVNSIEQGSVFDRFKTTLIKNKINDPVDEHYGKQSLNNLTVSCLIQLLFSKHANLQSNITFNCCDIDYIIIN